MFVSLITRECRICGEDALLKDAGPATQSDKYRSVYVCRNGHETKVRYNGPEDPELEASKERDRPSEASTVRRLNDLLDKIGVEPDDQERGTAE